MTRENPPTNVRSPITAVTIVLVMTWAVLAGLGWFSYSSYHKTKATTQQRVRIEELRGSIIRLDEVLTMSARMAAFTGDPQWENRYRRFEPQLDAASDQPKMHFEVVDSGIGMTRQQIANLFKPFNQADTSTTRKHGGTGLGLTISKRLAGKLGGNIAVRSTPGEGSTFTVTVGTGPLAGVELLDNPTEAQLPTDPDKKPAAATAKLDCRVLLAEDGPDNQRLIAFLLDKVGADVTVAENGKIAHDLALAARDEGTPFDVILMDMQMPVMDGYEATGKLRQAAYTGPIIALTAHAMATDRDKCLEAGCDDYMTKPIDRKKLISIVAEYASRQELHTAGDANTSSSS